MMAQKEIEALNALEHLMEEFFSPAASNERKRDIESQLENFSQQRDAWRMSIYFVKHTASPFVTMYALSNLESVINRQWKCMEATDQMYLIESLNIYTFEMNNTTPNFVRNKLAKVLVDVGKNEWPKYYLEHYTILMQLLQSEETQLFGLILLRTTSEEILSPTFDMSSTQKDILCSLCAEHIPQIFQSLTLILDGLSSRRERHTTATPPPSPTHPSQSPNLAQQISAASFRPDSREILRETFSTVQHLFSWANLTHIPHELIAILYKFTTVSSYAQDEDDMCLLAMTVLNELLYRKCAPPGSNTLFVQIYHHTVQLMCDITNPLSNKIETLGIDFIEKLSELLTLLFEQHFWRLESEPTFTAMDLLQYLYQLTMQLPSAQGYVRCLGVWAAFIKQIKPQNMHKYLDALLGLIIVVLNKMQCTTNLAQLEEGNDIEVDDEHESDWQIFQNACIEVIAMVAEFAPFDIFSRILMQWKNVNDIYSMLRTIDTSNGSLKLAIHETQRLHCILKDLATLTQTLARLLSLFTDQGADHYKEALPTIQSLIGTLIESTCLSSAVGFYSLKIEDQRLIKDYMEVQCQLLSALKTYCTSSNLNGCSKSKDLHQLLLVVLPLIRSTQPIPPKVTLSAAHLLLSITSIIHPPNFIQIPEALELLHVAHSLKYPKNQSREVTICALATFLLKPWGDLSTHDAQARNALIANLFDAVSREYRTLNEYSGDAAKCRDVSNDCLPCLTNIIDYCKEYPNNSKKLLYAGLKSTIEHTLALFPAFTKYPEVNDMQLQFFYKVLEVLQQQFGINGVRQAVDVFLGVAIREQERKQFAGLDMLLKILQLVIEAPGSSYKNFIEGIFELCMKNIYPTLILQANEYPDAIIALINLLHSILFNRWNYFYVSQIRLGNSPGCSDVEPAPDISQEQEKLMQALQVFGQCLMQHDINIFRASLGALENLNTKWKLYHKALFREQLLCQFLSVLLQTLVDKTHNLLNEDIMQAFYNMAAVGFPQFFDTFLTQYLGNVKGLTPQQRIDIKHNFTQATDMPTFTQNLQRFINDIRCTMISNASLPAPFISFYTQS